MKTLLSLALLLLVTISCKTETKKQSDIVKETVTIKSFENLARLHWLIGNWNNITLEQQSYENWRKDNDSTLKARSFTLVKSDTVFAERVTLQQIENDIYFTAVAYNQNDDQPVTFKMISKDNGVFTFENPEHDFPTRISYSNPVKDSIHAWIEGTVEGQPRKVDFYFIRQKE